MTGRWLLRVRPRSVCLFVLMLPFLYSSRPRASAADEAEAEVSVKHVASPDLDHGTTPLGRGPCRDSEALV